MDKTASRALIVAVLSVAIAGHASPAAGEARDFSIANQTGAALRDLALRRVGDRAWHSLPVAPASGASVRAPFSSPDCAFDIRATISGVGQVVWSGVNLCDVKSVTLNRDPSGRHWVDYD